MKICVPISTLLLVVVLLVTTHHARAEQNYFDCAGKLLDFVTDVRVTIKAMDELDYQKTQQTTCRTDVSNCERISEQIGVSETETKKEIEVLNKRFDSIVSYCLAIKS